MTGAAFDPFAIACDRFQFEDFVAGGTNAERLAEMKRVLLRLIDEGLTDAQRDAVMLRYFEGRSVGEIAQMRGCCPSTVSRTLARARSRLEKVLRYWQHR